MQFKSFMEALKGKQHKIDKNKNGQIDAHDFKLLRKEETEQLEEGLDPSEVASNPKMYDAATVKKAYYHKSTSAADKEYLAKHLDRHHGNKEWRKPVKEEAEQIDELSRDTLLSYANKVSLDSQKHSKDPTRRSAEKANRSVSGYAKAHNRLEKPVKEESEIEESEERMARADYKVGPSGRKSHKEIVFNTGNDKEKEDVKEAKMSDADMAERERIVKGMKKNLAGFKARYGDRAKEVMYATATKQAMKEETVEEAVQKADIPAYLRKQQGQTPLKLADLKRKDTISDKENLAKLRNEELDEAFINGREYASHGLMHPDHAKWQSHRVGVHTDFYAHGTGDKINGQVVKNDGKEVHIKATKSSGGKLHKFKVQRGLPNQQNEAKEETPPFDGPYTKAKPETKDKSGAVHTPMSRAKHLARMAMKKQMKEDIDRLFEAKDDSEYNYEGEMAITQLKTICRHAEALEAKMQPDTNLPEWVQSKITLATDYLQTAHDYLMSELDEQAPVAPVPGQKWKSNAVMVHKQTKQRVVIDRKNVKNYPEHEGWKEVAPGMKLKEDDEVKFSYNEFAMMLEYETKDGIYRHKGTYGGNYVDPEGADDADDKKPKQQPAEKRGRGRPAGAKSGARKITGTSKLFK
jgi:hypothetical protein